MAAYEDLRVDDAALDYIAEGVETVEDLIGILAHLHPQALVTNKHGEFIDVLEDENGDLILR